MTNKMKFRGSAAMFCLFAMSIAFGSPTAPDYTVGDFAVNLAKMITQKPEITPEDAVTFLGELGVELKGELHGQVSEQALVDAFNHFGLSLMTSNPEQTVTAQKAGHVFQMFDRNDELFSSEIFRLCKGGAGDQNTPCVTDADCEGGFCQELQSIRCQAGPNDGETCMTDSDCPMGVCNVPPGQGKKVVASPDD